MGVRCYIAGAGEFISRFLPERGDFIIAADAGYENLSAHGYTPDLVVGDFDSLGSAPDHPNVIHTPAEKDDTDVMLAVKHGFAHGCTSFLINGGLGGQLDHTLANIQIAGYISRKGSRCVLIGRDICVTAVTNGSVGFLPQASGRVSVFCMGNGAEGVTLSGLKYPLKDATLTSDHPLGVSNEFTGAPATITVRDGTLIVTWDGSPDVIAKGGI